MPDLSLEERVARLENQFRVSRPTLLTPKSFAICFALTAAAVGLAYRGLGLPNHPYQGALGVLTIGLAYHRRWLRWPAHPAQWIIAGANALILSMLLKLVIGSGIRQPFHWVLYPTIQKWELAWQPAGVTGWRLDLTVIQTFLLLITLIGALFRFQPFVSLTAFALILVSLPAFSEFDWPWIFPAIATAAVALYGQSTSGSKLSFASCE